MPQTARDEVVTLRLTAPEKYELTRTAGLTGQRPASLAATFVREGVRRARFPAVEFRDGEPGRVAYLAGTRWPVWMVVQLVEECDGSLDEASKQTQTPEALIQMALDYAAAYPKEVAASVSLRETRDYEGLKRLVPDLERL